jgi:hypothetical protein
MVPGADSDEPEAQPKRLRAKTTINLSIAVSWHYRKAAAANNLETPISAFEIPEINLGVALEISGRSSTCRPARTCMAKLFQAYGFPNAQR